MSTFWDSTPDHTDEKVIDLTKRRAMHLPPWYDLMRLKENVPLPTVANALVIFANDPDLRGMLAFNEFSYRAVLTRPPPSTPNGQTTGGTFPRSWEAADVGLVHAYFQRQYCDKFSAEAIQSAMQTEATINPFHPVRGWIDSLKWDGEPRLQFWLIDTFGCDNDLYHKTVAVKFCTAAVRRIRKPGCKFDSMLILEGDQDLGKSRACRTLFCDEWFTDSLPDLSGRDASAALEGIWGLELAEIEHLIRSEPETVKAFLSRQVERYRPSYGRTVVERPRQCVLIGTTNRDDYARDSTGNRRYWPVRCVKADVEWLLNNREQLWAEAAVIEAAGEALWLDDAVVRIEAKLQQSMRNDEDPWEGQIIGWLNLRDTVQVAEILVECLQLPADKRNKSAQMRVADILRKNKWTRDLSRRAGRVGRWWDREVVT